MSDLKFSSILLASKNYNEYIFEDERRALTNLAQINIFIEKNSSGKSRLLRKIFADEELMFFSPALDITEIRKLLFDFEEQFKSITSHNNYFEDENRSLKELKLQPWLTTFVDYRPLTTLMNNLKNRFDEINSIDATVKKCFQLITDYYPKIMRHFPGTNDTSHHFKVENIYIPTLRGLRPIQVKNSTNPSFDNLYDSYLNRTKHDYFINQRENLDTKIYTGLNLYIDLKKHLQGDKYLRKMVREFEQFLSETFFENEKVELVPNINSDVVYVTIGEHEHPIYDLGDGIQTIIILTYPLFFNQNKNLKVFIEEPETFLHPGFQRLFLETLKKPEFKKFQYFLTTHSNHFLDLTLDINDISVFTFEKKHDHSNSNQPKFTVLNVENSNTNILSLIGVRNSSVFLSNCTIWVEGITDRIYVRKYLEIIQAGKKTIYKEDTHFSFVEYGGNNITHWSFLSNMDASISPILVERLCGKLFLITDNDNDASDNTVKPSKKLLRKDLLSNKLGSSFFCLECREIENLLTSGILKSIIIQFEKKNGETLDYSRLDYSKYKSKYLGSFINENVKGLLKNYASESGTIANKVNFAKKAIDFMTNKSDISEDAIELAEKIYDFIQSNNTA